MTDCLPFILTFACAFFLVSFAALCSASHLFVLRVWIQRAVIELLRPNPRIPNLFRRDESQRGDRACYKLNLTIDEALETMRAAAAQLRSNKFAR